MFWKMPNVRHPQPRWRYDISEVGSAGECICGYAYLDSGFFIPLSPLSVAVSPAECVQGGVFNESSDVLCM